MRKITEIIIHCTATRPNWWYGESARDKVAEVRRWHTQERGWSDIGYHFLIDRSGEVVEGRPMSRDGAHVKGRNRGTIGISLFGGHGGGQRDGFDAHFTEKQETALVNLIHELHDNYGVVPVTGHNDYAAKGCPCFDARAWWRAHKAPQPPSHPYPAPAAPPPSREAPQGFWAWLLGLFGGK